MTDEYLDWTNLPNVEEQEEDEDNGNGDSKKETKPQTVKPLAKTNIFEKFAEFGKGSGKMLDNIEINRGRETSGCNIGDEVTITNGIYTDKVVKIDKFIIGGIEGTIDKKLIKIKHGSYYRNTQ